MLPAPSAQVAALAALQAALVDRQDMVARPAMVVLVVRRARVVLQQASVAVPLPVMALRVELAAVQVPVMAPLPLLVPAVLVRLRQESVAPQAALLDFPVKALVPNVDGGTLA
jgi:hypothetical protein